MGSDSIYDMAAHTATSLHISDDAIVIGWSPDAAMLLYKVPSDFTSAPIYAYVLQSQMSVRLPAGNDGGLGFPMLWRAR